jgi:hypothetical protein
MCFDVNYGLVFYFFRRFLACFRVDMTFQDVVLNMEKTNVSLDEVDDFERV